MEVYRICYHQEIVKIFRNKSFKHIGYKYDYMIANNHHYQKNIRYLHFFEMKYNIFNKSTTKGKYICTYDIPSYILDDYHGYGIYQDPLSFKHTTKIDEYAIPSSILKKEYLTKVELITQDVDIYDYLEDDSLSQFTEVIYESGKLKPKVRKKC